jgi:hypothetical protein
MALQGRIILIFRLIEYCLMPSKIYFSYKQNETKLNNIYIYINMQKWGGSTRATICPLYDELGRDEQFL